MKTITILLLILLSICMGISGCSKTKSAVPEGTTECIRKKISQIESEPVTSPPARIWQYDYKGKTVYFIPAPCCDYQSELYDTACNLLCRPDGGIAGNGDGKCPDFFSQRTNEKLYWEDARK